MLVQAVAFLSLGLLCSSAPMMATGPTDAGRHSPQEERSRALVGLIVREVIQDMEKLNLNAVSSFILNGFHLAAFSIPPSFILRLLTSFSLEQVPSVVTVNATVRNCILFFSLKVLSQIPKFLFHFRTLFSTKRALGTQENAKLLQEPTESCCQCQYPPDGSLSRAKVLHVHWHLLESKFTLNP